MPVRTKKKEQAARRKTMPRETASDPIELRLYVVNETRRCVTAYDNLVRICEENGFQQWRITVIDLLKDPAIAREAQITAIPTLVIGTETGKQRKIIGTLADAKKVVEGLNFMKQQGIELALR